MSSEVVRYARENITPDEFMRPPTEAYRSEIDSLNLDLGKRINRILESEQRALNKPSLRIGSEIELLMFSSESDPAQDLKKHDKLNPNYSGVHLTKVRKLMSDLVDHGSKYNLRDIIESRINVDRIFGEIRTKPTTVGNYITSMDRLKHWMQKKSGELGISPVVYSQHFHFSMAGFGGTNNVLRNEVLGEVVAQSMLSVYSRSLAMTNLPEDVEGDPQYYEVDRLAVLYKGKKRSIVDPLRLEGRMNSHSYAFDPHLNLLINQIGLYNGLLLAYSLKKIFRRMPDAVYDFTIGRGYTSWPSELESLVNNRKIEQYIPRGLLEKIQNTLKYYWQISTNELTLRDARDLEYYRASIKS